MATDRKPSSNWNVKTKTRVLAIKLARLGCTPSLNKDVVSEEGLSLYEKSYTGFSF